MLGLFANIACLTLLVAALVEIARTLLVHRQAIRSALRGEVRTVVQPMPAPATPRAPRTVVRRPAAPPRQPLRAAA